MYIAISTCIELFIYIYSLDSLLLQPSCLEVIPGNAYMTVCFRYLSLEEALSLELELSIVSSSKEVFSSVDHYLCGGVATPAEFSGQSKLFRDNLS